MQGSVSSPSSPTELLQKLNKQTGSLTVLIVEDEEAMSHLLSRSMARAGFQTILAGDCPTAQAVLQSARIGLVLLDARLPSGSGYDLCRQIRHSTDVPVIMLTAMSREQDIVQGLEAGADDYIVKPFLFSNLLTHIYALLRRVYQDRYDEGVALREPHLRPHSQEVVVCGRTISLTPIEFKLLSLLHDAGEETLSYRTIMLNVWGYPPEGKASILYTNIRRLRQKLEQDPAHPAHIITVAGFGYKYLPSVPCE